MDQVEGVVIKSLAHVFVLLGDMGRNVIYHVPDLHLDLDVHQDVIATNENQGDVRELMENVFVYQDLTEMIVLKHAHQVYINPLSLKNKPSFVGNGDDIFLHFLFEKSSFYTKI